MREMFKYVGFRSFSFKHVLMKQSVVSTAPPPYCVLAFILHVMWRNPQRTTNRYVIWSERKVPFFT